MATPLEALREALRQALHHRRAQQSQPPRQSQQAHAFPPGSFHCETCGRSDTRLLEYARRFYCERHYAAVAHPK